MKNFITLAVVSCLAAAIYGLVDLPKGYKDASRTFDDYVNQPRDDVEKSLSLIMPNVQFKVYVDPEQNRFSEEFYYGKIKLVVNDKDVVIQPPTYYGVEPDLSLAGDLIGMDRQTAVSTISEKFPDAKFVVQTEDGMISSQSNNKVNDYILIVISQKDQKVIEPPKFVRVLKNN